MLFPPAPSKVFMHNPTGLTFGHRTYGNVTGRVTRYFEKTNFDVLVFFVRYNRDTRQLTESCWPESQFHKYFGTDRYTAG